MADVNLYVEEGPLQDFPEDRASLDKVQVLRRGPQRGPLRATIVKLSRP